jgi:hypothetical protein
MRFQLTPTGNPVARRIGFVRKSILTDLFETFYISAHLPGREAMLV